MSFWIKKIDQPHETRIVLTWNRGWDRMKLVIIPLGLALFAILPLLLSSVDLIDLDYLQLSLSLKRLATFITGLLLLLCLGFYFFAKAFNNSHFVFAHQDYALKRKHSPFFWGRIKTIDLKKIDRFLLQAINSEDKERTKTSYRIIANYVDGKQTNLVRISKRTNAEDLLSALNQCFSDLENRAIYGTPFPPRKTIKNPIQNQIIVEEEPST